MHSNLLKICLVSVLTLSFSACGYEDGADPNENGIYGVKCSSGETICHPGNTSVLVCNAAGNGYDEVEACAYGCDKGVCRPKPDADKQLCRPNSIECHNDRLVKCNAEGSAIEEEPCPYGCEKGETTCNIKKCTLGVAKCNDDRTAALTCNANGTWDEEACDYGCEHGACKCKPGEDNKICTPNAVECKNNTLNKCNAEGSAIEEEPCPYGCEEGAKTCSIEKCPTGETKCNDDKTAALTCNANGTWDEEKCTYGCEKGACVTVESLEACSPEDLAACEALSESYDMDITCYVNTEGSATCVPKCAELGSTRTVCDDEQYYDTSLYQCIPIGEDGTGTWNFVESLEDCKFGCNDDLTACAEVLIEDLGQPCTPDRTRDDRCDGNIVSFCHWTYEIVAAVKCNEGLTCVELDDEGRVYAGCYAATDACTEDTSTCEEDYGSAMLTVFECRPSRADPDTKYPISWSGACESRACLDNISCKPPLVDDLFARCTPEDRPDRCDGNVYSTCYYDAYERKSYVTAVDCLEEGYDVCSTVDGTPSCFKTCDSMSDPEHTCAYDAEYEGFVVGTNACVQDDAEANFVAQKTVSKICASGCNETNDGCAYADEGEACISDMAATCEGNIAVYCNAKGQIAADPCPLLYGEGWICYMDEENKPRCDEGCDLPGEVVPFCRAAKFMGVERFREYTRKCLATPDGKAIYGDIDDPAWCTGGCNDTGTACE